MFMQVRTALLAGAIALPTGIAYAQMTGMDQSDTQQSQRSSQQARATQGASADNQTQRQLIEMLRMGNQGEIELAQLAQQQAQSDEVKQYAQQMIRDHQQFLQQLDRVAPAARAMGDTSDQQQRLSQAGGLTGTGAAGDTDGGMQGTTRDRDSADAAGGASASANRERGASAGPNAGIGARDTDPTTGTGNDMAEASRSGQTGAMAGAAGAELDAAGAQVYGFAAGAQGSLAQVLREVHQQHLQSTRQMLSEKQGTEFDKAYMDSQCMMHQGMLDKLQVFSRHVDQDVRQVLQQGQQTVRQHLEEARQIKQQLDRQG